MSEPTIIQGGMGAGVSGWRLARAVAEAGQMGVVSGTALDVILVRRLQDGDGGGHLRRALAHFPDQTLAQEICRRYFLPAGRPAGQPYCTVPLYTITPPIQLQQLTMVANFVEIWLAKEGHHGVVGINYLEKIQLPNLASIYGAMLAQVDYILMGAGIPREIPGIMDRLTTHQPAQLTVDVKGAAAGEKFLMDITPATLLNPLPAPLPRPKFLAIVSSASLATIILRKSTGKVDGFVVEHNTAGGHNAPPRGAMQLDAAGEPIYGARDEINAADMKNLGVPFWLAGGFGHPDRLKAALEVGAAGVQVGTAFAFCEESGLVPSLRRRVLEDILAGTAQIRTDPRASPTGYPFKVINAADSLADEVVYEARRRRCDLGYLRTCYKDADGRVAYRCPSETPAAYLQKGGAEEDLDGRKCLCNGLVANIGLAQELPNGEIEHPILTAGNDLPSLRRFLAPGRLDYSAADVLAYLLAHRAAAVAD